MTLRYVVFDWDGTLADTYPVISAAYKHTFEALGMQPMEYSEIKKLTSTLANKDTLGYIFGDKKEQAKQAYYAYIEANHKTQLRPIPHAKELLDFCQSKGWKLYLLSNKKRTYLREEMNYLGFADYFAKVIAAGDFPEDKPNPQTVRALFDNGLPDATDIVVIGDGMADWKTSQALNHSGKSSRCIIYDPQNNFSQVSPDYVVSDVADIIEILRDESNE